MNFKLAISGLILTTAVYASGAEMAVTSMMPISLGKGWDPFFPEENKMINDCYAHTKESSKMGSTDSFNENFIESKRQLEEFTKASALVTFNGSFSASRVGIAAAYDRETSKIEQGRTITWILSGKRSYYPEHASIMALSARGERVLKQATDSANPEYFFRTCGRSVVTSIKKESNIAVIYQLVASDSQYADRIRSSLRGKFSGATVKATAEADFIREVKAIDQNIQINIKVFQSGRGQNKNGVEKVLTLEPGNLAAVRQAMALVLDDINYESAPITLFSHERASVALGLPLTTDRFALLETLTIRQEKNRQTVKNIRRYLKVIEYLLENSGQNGYDITRDNTQLLEQKYAQLENQLIESLEMIEICGAAGALSSCKVLPPVLVKGLTQYISRPYAEAIGWGAEVVSAYYDAPPEQVKATVDYFPIVKFKNIDLISHVEIYIGNSLYKTLIGADLGRINPQTNSIRDFLVRRHFHNPYCWRGRWGEDCNPWAADSNRHIEALKKNEAANTYSLKIYDIDGNVEVVQLGNANNGKIIR
jgi:hypothetical protein